MEKLNITAETNETERPVLGRTADGAIVRDRIDSHFHPEGGLTKELLAEAISRIDTEGRRHIVEQVEFDHQVGYQSCVEVGPDDDVEMVFRKGRSGRTPMVHGREPQPTNSVVVIIGRDQDYSEDGNYMLATSFVGTLATREPWDPGLGSGEEIQEAEEFWSKHALLYNEDLIDKERTEEFENMSEEDKSKELLREKVLYAGVFVNPDELYSKAPATLAHPIARPHITTNFRPSVEQLHLDALGSGAKIYAVGYGNDGRNEGLQVRIEAENPEIQAACDALDTPHITLSVADGAFAKDTANLEFSPLDEPIELTGNYGLFSHGEIIDKYED